MNVRTICHIFNFIGCRNVDWLIVKGKNQLDIIIINENRFNQSINQPFLVFLKPQIEVAECVEGEDNKLLGNLQSLASSSLILKVIFSSSASSSSKRALDVRMPLAFRFSTISVMDSPPAYLRNISITRGAFSGSG